MAKKKVESQDKNYSIETLKKEIKDELTNEFHNELKEEMTFSTHEYIDNKIKKSINIELEKTNKKLLREKTKKIILKDIIIIILLLIIFYLVYLLYNIDYFDAFFLKNNLNKNNEKYIPVSENTNKETEPTLTELKGKYQYLLDNIYLNEESIYLNDYYNGNLTPEIKLYLTLNTLDINQLNQEEDYNIIGNDIIETQYKKIFKDNYKSSNFDYNDNLIRYINKLDYYISTHPITKNKTNIIKEISNIELTDNEIIITTIEGLLINNEVYNILTNEKVSNYKINNLSKNIDKLNKVIYTFNKDNQIIDIAN